MLPMAYIIHRHPASVWRGNANRVRQKRLYLAVIPLLKVTSKRAAREAYGWYVCATSRSPLEYIP